VHYVGRGSGLCSSGFECSLVFFAEEEVAPTSLGAGGLRNDRGLLSFLGIERSPIIALLPDLQICKFVKAYAHNPVNLDAVAASSSASSEATDGPTGV
jgi:hypothetical protein